MCCYTRLATGVCQGERGERTFGACLRVANSHPSGNPHLAHKHIGEKTLDTLFTPMLTIWADTCARKHQATFFHDLFVVCPPCVSAGTFCGSSCGGEHMLCKRRESASEE